MEDGLIFVGLKDGTSGMMRCPQCHAPVRFAEIAKHCCANCSTKIFLHDRWRLSRAVACGCVSLLVNVRWYPLEGGFLLHVAWCFAMLLTFLVLLLGSIYVLPPEVAQLPSQGPIQLGL